VVARIGRTGDCRWWLAGGLVAGLGVADDHSMAFFAVALVIGTLLSGGRPMIWNRWFLAGAAIAVCFEVPDLWWQAGHQWATIAMTRALNEENGGLANVATWIYGQLTAVTVATVWVWVVGLRFLWRSGVWKSLPPRRRDSAVIFAGDYGEAGAINELRRGTGLPTAVSGDTEWCWGPGNAHATTVVAVIPGPVDISGSAATAYLRQFFTHVRVAATLSNPDGIHNQEWHGYVCTGRRDPWAQLWPGLRHYS